MTTARTQGEVHRPFPKLSPHFGGFEIDQSPGSGDIYCSNLTIVTRTGRAHIWRGLNSRDEWPIFVATDDDEAIEILDKTGNFTEEFVQWAAGSRA